MLIQQTTTPVFSIIVPVYNVEKYVEKCLLSLVNQTLKDIEVIMVDDGSTDRSLEMCQQFATQHKHFHVFSKKNEGQGVARNFGLQKAIGEFICYVDSDDWIENELCSDMYQILRNTNADFINFGLDFINQFGTVMKEINTFSVSEVTGKDVFHMAMLDDQILSSPCNKVYRRLFLISNEIQFPSLKANEDIYYSRAVSLFSEKAIFISKTYYHALVRDSSTTRNMSIRNFTETDALFAYEKKQFSIENSNPFLQNLFQAHVIKTLSVLLIQATFRIQNKDELMACFDIARKCRFYEYSSRLDVLRLIKTKNILFVKICAFPKMLQLLVAFSKIIKLHPY